MHFDLTALPVGEQPYPGRKFVTVEFRVIIRSGPKAIANGDFDLVSPHWYDRLAHLSWSSDPNDYARRHLATTPDGKRPIIRMHLEIARGEGIMPETVRDENGKRIECDHIDRNRRNNTVENLRLATTSLNRLNRDPQRNNTSGCSGVSWHSQHKKWQVRVSVNGNKRRTHLGYFDSREAAVAACLSRTAKRDGRETEIPGHEAGDSETTF